MEKSCDSVFQSVESKRSVLSFLKYFLFNISNIVRGESVDDIYDRFRLVVCDKMNTYQLEEIERIDINQVISDLDNLKHRLIIHLRALEIKQENKEILVTFFAEWSNVFVRIELVKLKTGLITEKEFIRNLYMEIQRRLNFLSDKLENQSVNLDRETKQILEAIQLVVITCQLMKHFDSLDEIKKTLLGAMEIFDSLSNILNGIFVWIDFFNGKRGNKQYNYNELKKE